MVADSRVVGGSSWAQARRAVPAIFVVVCIRPAGPRCPGLAFAHAALRRKNPQTNVLNGWAAMSAVSPQQSGGQIPRRVRRFVGPKGLSPVMFMRGKQERRSTLFTRRRFIQGTTVLGAASLMPRWVRKAWAVNQGPGLSDPALQPKFANAVPNALDPGFIYRPKKGVIDVGVAQSTQMTGLVGPGGTPVPTTIWGYGDASDDVYTWPGRTFEVKSYEPLAVTWENKLVGPGPDKTPLPFLITGKDNSPSGSGTTRADPFSTRACTGPTACTATRSTTSPRTAYRSCPMSMAAIRTSNSTATRSSSSAPATDGQRAAVDREEVPLRQRPAGGYALVPRPRPGYHPPERLCRHGRLLHRARRLSTPVSPAIRSTCRPFPMKPPSPSRTACSRTTGELFYPAFPGDPFYADFITGEGCDPADRIIFPGGGPTGLAEFFGDHMVVNGVIWPKMDVEPRNYRLRLLNGCDSRFLAVQFFEVPTGETDFTSASRAAALHGDRQRPGSGLQPDHGRHAADGDRLALRHHLRLQAA